MLATDADTHVLIKKWRLAIAFYRHGLDTSAQNNIGPSVYRELIYSIWMPDGL